MVEPAQASLGEHCEHAWDSHTLKYVLVRYSILPRDAEDASQAAQVETVETAFLSGIRCPGFTAVE